ncbi:YkvA family protein [Leptotrichia sp. oral taxon 221]|mgnify:FL=1|jgi:hypothetical protein|uniref:YkvA family protein n=1 Tax=Leptotrichia sp. oral taxon 221 TaxID=712362 RepID=UPI001B8B5129|nr:YkvA family protein [Leptotrichia sp. oral taxon 221]QUB96801.1 DUF1232 domain-containing protein [Leptotrichia sp. oral taxon 221]
MIRKAKKFYEGYKKTKITLEQLKKANNLKGNLGEIGNKFALLVRMMRANLKGEFEISTADKLKIVGAIVYVITTLDAVPDIIPVLGFGDDIGVVAYVIGKLGKLIKEYEEFERVRRNEEKDKNVDFDNLKVVNEI